MAEIDEDQLRGREVETTAGRVISESEGREMTYECKDHPATAPFHIKIKDGYKRVYCLACLVELIDAHGIKQMSETPPVPTDCTPPEITVECNAISEIESILLAEVYLAKPDDLAFLESQVPNIAYRIAYRLGLLGDHSK